jgi:hypothetical protein
VRRLERAQLAAAHQRIKKQSESETASVSGGDDMGLGQDLEAHYQISKSRKDPLNIYSYVHANHGDPAFDVRLCIAQKKIGDIV